MTLALSRRGTMLLPLAAAGCATDLGPSAAIFPPFLPWSADSSASIRCELITAQPDIFVFHPKFQLLQGGVPSGGGTNPPPGRGGTAGAAVGGAVADLVIILLVGLVDNVGNGIRDAQANAVGAPLVGRGLGTYFTDKLLPGVQAAIRSSRWVHPSQVDVRETPLPPNTPLPPGALLRVAFTYVLSWDARALIVTASLNYYRDTNSGVPNFRRTYFYISEPVSPETDAAAVAVWAANGQAALRRAMNEAATEMVHMISVDFLAPDIAGRGLSSELYNVKFFDETTLKDNSVMGRILSRSGTRVLFQSDNGNLLSVVPLSATVVRR